MILRIYTIFSFVIKEFLDLKKYNRYSYHFIELMRFYNVCKSSTLYYSKYLKLIYNEYNEDI